MDSIRNEFETAFSDMKKQYKVKATLAELDAVFSILDYISKEGYIGTSVAHQIARRIIDVFGSWVNYLHGILVPNPNSLVNMQESSLFSESDKEKAMQIMSKMMSFSSHYNMLALKNDVKQEALFVDETLVFWTKEAQPVLLSMVERTKIMWQNNTKKKPEVKNQKSRDVMYG